MVFLNSKLLQVSRAGLRAQCVAWPLGGPQPAGSGTKSLLAPLRVRCSLPTPCVAGSPRMVYTCMPAPAQCAATRRRWTSPGPAATPVSWMMAVEGPLREYKESGRVHLNTISTKATALQILQRRVTPMFSHYKPWLQNLTAMPKFSSLIHRLFCM